MNPSTAREVRIMAEKLASQAHDEAHAALTARLVRDLGNGRRRPPIRGDYGGGSVLLLAAAVPLIVLLILAVSNLAGAVAGIAAAGGAQ